MTTFTAARAAAAKAVHQAVGSGIVNVAYGTLEVAANPVADDIYVMCKVPAGAVILGGNVYADDMDTGTETLDMDLGWAANGGSGTYDSADPDGLGNWGVWTGDAFAAGNIANAAGINLPFAGNFINGDLPVFTRETTIQLVCIATAATFAAGALSVVVYYAVP